MAFNDNHVMSCIVSYGRLYWFAQVCFYLILEPTRTGTLQSLTRYPDFVIKNLVNVNIAKLSQAQGRILAAKVPKILAGSLEPSGKVLKKNHALLLRF